MGVNSAFGKCAISEIKLCKFKDHGKGDGHMKALQKMAAAILPEEDAPALDFGAVSGLSEDVPRLDRWVAALTLVEESKPYQALVADAAASSVGGGLRPGGDCSQRVARQMIASMAADLSKQDRKMMKAAVKSSISFDKSNETLLVYCRVLSKHGIYDFLLGLEGDVGPNPDDAIRATQNIMKRACTEPQGKRPQANAYSGPEDHFKENLHSHFLRSVVSAVADGGPVEQKSLFMMSPLPIPDASGQEVEENQHETIFQNLRMISRDRPHRHRSVHRGFWSNLPDDLTAMLEELVTGQRSLCRLLEESVKMRAIFQQKQRDAKHQHTAETFCKILRNFAYSEIRFDSRTRPLYRMFRLLPIVIDCLQELSSADDDRDRRWATELLQSWSGDAGYEKLVGAAVVADALMMGKTFLQLEDAAHADLAVSGEVAAELLFRLRCMLFDGGLFLAESEQTLTHTVLRSIMGRAVLLGGGTNSASAMLLRWPSPESAARRKPIATAQKPRPQELI